jgi:hypothetical protein
MGEAGCSDYFRWISCFERRWYAVKTHQITPESSWYSLLLIWHIRRKQESPDNKRKKEPVAALSKEITHQRRKMKKNMKPTQVVILKIRWTMTIMSGSI